MHVSRSSASGLPSGVNPAHAPFLISTHETLMPRQQAQELGISESRVRQQRTLLYRAGLIHPTRRAKYRPFTPEEIARAESLLKGGMRAADVAATLGRTYKSLMFLLEREGISARDLRHDAKVYSQRQAATILGVNLTTMRRLCEVGAIPLVRAGVQTPQARKKTRAGKRVGDRRQYTIPYADLVAFLGDRRYWMVWDAAQVTNANLRRLAEMYREAQPGQWMTLREVARAQYWSGRAAGDWIARGWPGPGWTVETWGETRYVWIPAGEALPAPPADRRYQRAA